MNKIQVRVLECLLDSYEKSKTFQGENQVNQSFSVNLRKLFPKYYDDAEYEYFCQVNDAMEELQKTSMVFLEYEKNGVLRKVKLNTDSLDACYCFLERLPRKQEQEELAALWQRIMPNEADERLTPLKRYIEAQLVRIEKNQNIEYYSHDMEEYQKLLLLAEAVLKNREEIFIRNFSIQFFHDSKSMEKVRSKLNALLYQYGDFLEKDFVLEECGIVSTPTYVTMKGNGILALGEQKIDLSRMHGDIALSTKSLKELKDIRVLGKRVVTIENLTTFHDYPAEDDFVIYLGGFHNKIKRDFLMYLSEKNPEKEYRHFGDIDAGGFYILEHLKRKTGIGFRSLYMGPDILRQYKNDVKPLTGTDRERLMRLKDILNQRKDQGGSFEDYSDVLGYMLTNNCKLEQEAIKLPPNGGASD